ncbi:tyrosine-type recombinase/integrase [Embleya sp. NPDC056575]|uniref:tyrosine-type recombinase/integrase n=1 Tax=unclassified Embleya TaxID=2699296 RepID=UPI0036A355D1
MPKKAQNNPRQIRVKSCGCALCVAKYPDPPRRPRRDCIGSWQARWRRPDGTGTSRNFRTKTEAENHLDNVKSDLHKGTYIDPKRGKQLLRKFRPRWRNAQDGAETTLERDDRLWANHIDPKWGGYPLVAIEHLDVKAWVKELGQTLAPGTIIKVHQILDRMLTAAHVEKRIPLNPCEGIKLPTIPKKHPEDRRPPTVQQLDLVRAKLPEYHHPLEIFLEETGLRWGEATGMRLCNVDFERKRIHVREILIEVGGALKRKAYPKSDAGLRTVGMTPRAEEALKAAMALRAVEPTRSAIGDGMCKEELLFRGRNGSPIGRNGFRRLWIPAIQAAGVARVTIDEKTGKKEWWPQVHTIRHHFASKLADLNVPEVVVQEVMGHERGGEVTWLYTHAAADTAGQVLAALMQERPKLVAV